jgi:capsular exopolysaccharide synthesis family protein
MAMMDFELKQESPKHTEINLLELWQLLNKRKWLIITFTLIVLASVALATYTAIPIYTAMGTLLIEQEPNILSFEQIFQIETYRDDFYQTQYKLLQSRSLAENVVKRLKLYENPEFVKAPKNGTYPAREPTPALIKNLAGSFLKNLEITPVKQTRMVEVSFSARDPQLAADGVNALFDSYVDMNIEAKYAATEQATEFLGTQISGLRTEIEGMEKKLQAYGAEKNIIALSDKETTIIDTLTGLNKALTDAQIDRINKESYYNEIKGASSDFIPEAIANSLIQRLREDYGRMSREYLKKQETLRPDYPEMQRLKTELESAKKSLENETQNLIKGAYSEYQAAMKKEINLGEVFNQQKQEAIKLNSNAIAYNSLKIEIDNKKNLLDSLLRRESETGVSARLRGLRTSNIRVVDRADVPGSPSSPNKKRNLILALVFGLFGGLSLAFFFSYLDNSVKTSEDVEKYAGLPSLGIVPLFSLDGFRKGYGYGYGHKRRKKPQRERRESNKKDVPGSPASGSPPDDDETARHIKSIELIPQILPRSDFSECYRSIRTALLFSAAARKMKTLVFTSPLPSEGKTATICNLGIAMAQANKKVLILDADLRKPRQHHIFKIKNISGLTNYLVDGIEMKDLIKATQMPNLYLVNSGPVPPNPAELLGSEKMTHFLKNLKDTFDYVLIDTPPLLAVSDALVMGSQIDGVVLVVWGGKTSREAVKRAKEKLDAMKMPSLGVIINRINVREHDYYYKHHYYHYYGES